MDNGHTPMRIEESIFFNFGSAKYTAWPTTQVEKSSMDLLLF